MALLVADVLAEFAAENTALIVRDEGARQFVGSVLERFAQPQLENYTAWSPLLRHTLGATVDGLLAHRDALASAKPWLDAVLDALAIARDETEKGQDFVTGLVRGKGYRTLLARGLLVAGERLAPDDAKPYQRIAADVLRAAAPHVAQGSQSFATFFQDNWGDLLRAGLASVERYGPALLEGEKPIVREATLALVSELARTPNASLFSGETLFGLANAVIGTVATRPELVNAGIREAWVKDLVGALVQTAGDAGLQQSLTREGLRDAFRTAAVVLGRHPELLSQRPGERVAMIGAVLKSVSTAGTVDARTLATGALTAVLERIGEQPQLLDTRYAEVLSGLAGEMAKRVGAGTLGSVQATDVVDAAAAALLRNPDLFTKFEGNLATAVASGVLRGSQATPLRLLGGKVLVDTIGETLRVIALRGRDLAETTNEQALVTKVSDTIAAGLARADLELGRRLDVTSLPVVLAGLVGAVAQGEIATIDADDPKLQEVFVVLAEAAIATRDPREDGR
jgi:F0F1-type ATP synthase membrane subunit c/vacuolar-type H+-ATPase subunit K